MTTVIWAEERLKPRRRLINLLSAAKRRASTKKVPFDLILNDLVDLWERQEGRCVLTGQEFDLAPVGPNPNGPSLDRIKPALGYTPGNVRLVTQHMNVALSEFGVEQFEHLIDSYRRHHCLDHLI